LELVDLESIDLELTGSATTKRAYVAAGAGFFFTLGFAGFGCTTGSGPRSIEVRRPAVKV
jgi:hypothetical protein